MSPFVSALRLEVLDERGLAIASAAGPEIIVAGDGCQATDADREAVVAWCSRFVGGDNLTIGPLSDVGPAA